MPRPSRAHRAGKPLVDIRGDGEIEVHPSLRRLAGRFASDGVLVLGGCNVMDADGDGHATQGLRKLSLMLGVEVRAGTELKNLDDGEIWHGKVTACRGGECVTANGEADLPAAWARSR